LLPNNLARRFTAVKAEKAEKNIARAGVLSDNA
jgi:hypothetical protein